MIKLNTPSHGSSVSLSNISRVELTGLVKILLKALCRQLAILVGVPTPDVIIGGVTLVDTTISSAAESAAKSSILLNWSKSSKLYTVIPNSFLILAKSSVKSVYCKLIKETIESAKLEAPSPAEEKKLKDLETLKQPENKASLKPKSN